MSSEKPVAPGTPGAPATPAKTKAPGGQTPVAQTFAAATPKGMQTPKISAEEERRIKEHRSVSEAATPKARGRDDIGGMTPAVPFSPALTPGDRTPVRAVSRQESRERKKREGGTPSPTPSAASRAKKDPYALPAESTIDGETGDGTSISITRARGMDGLSYEGRAARRALHQ